MDREPDFNAMMAFSGALPPPGLALPDEVLMTAYSYLKSLNR